MMPVSVVLLQQLFPQTFEYKIMSVTVRAYSGALKMRDRKIQDRKMRDHSNDVKFEGPKMQY